MSENPEKTFLVAITATSQEAVIENLRTLPWGDGIESFWIAEDDRQDGNDCDSAVFVPWGAQADVRHLISTWCDSMEQQWNEEGYPYPDVSGVWFKPTGDEGIESRKWYALITHDNVKRNPETGEWEPLLEGETVPSIVVGPYDTFREAAIAVNEDTGIDHYCCDTKNDRFVDDVYAIPETAIPADAERWQPYVDED